MSNLPEPPPTLTEKLTAAKVFGSIAAGIFVLVRVISIICTAVVFIHIGTIIPGLWPYASSAFYTIGARTVFFVTAFLAGCYWCCLRLEAPKKVGSSISEWALKVHETEFGFKLGASNGKLSNAVSGRRHMAIMGVANVLNGLNFVFPSRKTPDFRYRSVLGVILLLAGARAVYTAYVLGRLPKEKGATGENMPVGNNVGQPESDGVAPGVYEDDDTPTQWGGYHTRRSG